MPAKTPYEREVLFEHLDLYAKRHGTIRVELDRRQWTVMQSAKEQAPLCAACGHRIDTLTYALRERSLCALCAKRDVK